MCVEGGGYVVEFGPISFLVAQSEFYTISVTRVHTHIRIHYALGDIIYNNNIERNDAGVHNNYCWPVTFGDRCNVYNGRMIYSVYRIRTKV